MRTPRRVKQKMYYSLPHKGQPVYDTDEHGDIIYDVMPDGSRIPREIGQSPEGYDKPIEFSNSITSSLTEAEIAAYGSEGRNTVKMTYKKGEFPFVVGAVVWKESEIKYKDDGEPDDKSADYRVIGVQTVGRHFHKAMLEQIV